MTRLHIVSRSRLLGGLLALFLLAACGTTDDQPAEIAEAPTSSPTSAATPVATTAPVAAPSPTDEPAPTSTVAPDGDTTGSSPSSADGDSAEAPSTTAAAASASVDTATSPAAVTSGSSCEARAALFVTRGSANPEFDDPYVSAACDGDQLVISSNGIPDYTYIGTSPGVPTDRGHTFTIPASPTVADEHTAVPRLGTAAVSLGGIPIFGPTEGTGGDVNSIPGILSACGSHNGPSGFHIHQILSSPDTDCLFTPDEVAAAPQLVGFALDGFPIYTGIDQFESSWELTDESLFAVDTWAAHTYVAGSGDLDECNGRVDENGDYAYYTTATFPYVIGCYVGAVNLVAPGGDRPARPEGETGGETGAERPEPPEGDTDSERPEPPEGDTDSERPTPPEGEAGGERPEPPDRPERPEGERPERPRPPTDGQDADST